MTENVYFVRYIDEKKTKKTAGLVICTQAIIMHLPSADACDYELKAWN
jgi:hypothetical protein